jgi:A118 family predicted phage portal protein
MDRTASATGIARSYRTVFDIAGIPAFAQFYDAGIFVWKMLYRGYYKPWHLVHAPTVASPQATRDLYRLNTAKAVCAELAGLVWGEECEIDVTMDGRDSADPDPLGEFVRHVLECNAFREKMQEAIEQGCALGGSALKVWREVGRAEDGTEIPGTQEIRIGYSMADQFVPVSWDNAKVKEAVFISRVANAGWYYTRLEWHTWTGETYTVRNELYRSEAQKGARGDSQDILGIRVPLAEMYPALEEETVIPVGESLFSYWRTPVANNLDDNSPLGVSIFGNALETLHALDICYDSFVREFRLGKKRIIVPARAVRAVVDPQTGAMCRYFDANDETYEAMASDDPNDLKITDNSVTLRVQEHIDAINAFLNILCLQLGFSAGTFTFDASQGMMTATQVVSQNSKTYKTIRTVQNQLRPALEHLVRNIIEVAILYDMEWDGQKVANLAAGGYHVNITFDDGVTQDRQTNITEGMSLVGAGLLSRFKFLTDPKYGQGLTEEEATAELQRIREESKSGGTVDVMSLFGGGGE